VVADYDVEFVGGGAADEDIGGWKSGGAQACGYGFGDESGGSGGVGGFDFD
jgi:hypothetical protein